MSTGETIALLGVGGLLLYFVLGKQNTTVNPVTAASTGATYLPPNWAVPTGTSGWPSPSAPGPYGWGLIPQQPTDAQQAASVIGAIGGLANGVANIANAFTNDYNS